MNWTPQQNQELARMRHAELLRTATRRYALLRPDERSLEPQREPRSALARLFGRLSPAS